MVMPSALPAIATSRLTKRYGSLTALDGIDITVPQGVTYGFLGPNGAGKTTAIRLLLGFIRPTSGESRLYGHDCWRDGVRARADLGYLVPPDSLYPDMSGGALLDYMARLSGQPPRLRPLLLEALDLGDAILHRKLRTYSKGMKQKLALTAAIQTAPGLLILDEPTDGLDPLIQRAFEQVLDDVRQQGSTIFMSSHDLSEVERTCERVAIIRDGRIVAEESIGELKARHRRTATVTFTSDPPPGLDHLTGTEILHREGLRLVLSVEGSITPLLRFLAPRHDVEDLLLAPPNLEDIFLGFYDPTRPADDSNPSPSPPVQHRAAPLETAAR